MKSFTIALFLPFISSSPAFACYGEYCSTMLGVVYDYPWKVFNQITRPYPTSVESILDGTIRLDDIPPTTKLKHNYNFSYQICQNNQSSSNCKTIKNNMNRNP